MNCLKLIACIASSTDAVGPTVLGSIGLYFCPASTLYEANALILTCVDTKVPESLGTVHMSFS